MEKQDLSKMLIEDSEYYIANAPYVAFLKRHDIKTIDQIINGSFRNCSFNGHKMQGHTASSLKVFIRLLRHKYFDEPLLVDAYLDKTIDLEKAASSVAFGGVFSDGMIYIENPVNSSNSINLISFFGARLGDPAYNRFIAEINGQNKNHIAGKLPHQEVKVIDFFKWILTNEIGYHYLDSFAKTYIDSYEKNRELVNEDTETINILKDQLTSLIEQKVSLDAQIADIQKKIAELSKDDSKGGMGL